MLILMSVFTTVPLLDIMLILIKGYVELDALISLTINMAIQEREDVLKIALKVVGVIILLTCVLLHVQLDPLLIIHQVNV